MENTIYYVYQHIRLDTNEAFYIGIGTKSKKKHSTIKSTYYRVFTKTGRNTIWYNVVNKTDYRIEIVFEHYQRDKIKEKEKELIKLFIDEITMAQVSHKTGTFKFNQSN